MGGYNLVAINYSSFFSSFGICTALTEAPVFSNYYEKTARARIQSAITKVSLPLVEIDIKPLIIYCKETLSIFSPFLFPTICLAFYFCVAFFINLDLM
nr:MAG TPA: hypothetical protein [Caudoviricetes sp.]